MASIFISYGDKRFKKSLNLIKKEAKNIGIFDRIITYTPKDLPACIKSSPLFLFKKGGGYWIWKPYIIYKTLQLCHDDDIIYYADAGCTLNANSKEWEMLQREIDMHNAIFFQYRTNIQYEGWSYFCKMESNNSPEIVHWMKPATINYFTKFFNNQDFLHFNKIWGGAFIVKKNPKIIHIIEQWLMISIFHPELVCDPFGIELSQIPPSFNEHRHDQAILTPLLYHYKEKNDILIMNETSESNKQDAAIIASRRIIWTWGLFDRILYNINCFLKRIKIRSTILFYK